VKFKTVRLFWVGIAIGAVLSLDVLAQEGESTTGVAGSYVPCIVPPQFNRADFIKPDFVKKLIDHEDVEKRDLYAPDFIKPQFIRPEFVRSLYIPPTFERCPTVRLMPVGYKLEPMQMEQMVATNTISTNQLKDARLQLALAPVPKSAGNAAYQFTPAKKADDCCGADIKVSLTPSQPAVQKEKIN
jgi:hypothetical protein